MYDNISVKQSGKDLGRILKTSPDLSTVAVIANARQVSYEPHYHERTRWLWEGNRIASHNFQGKK